MLSKYSHTFGWHLAPALLAVFLAFALAACGGGGDDDDDDDDAGNGGDGGSSSEETQTADAGDRTPFTEEQIAELAMTDVEGYERSEPFVGPVSTTVGYTSDAEGLAVGVTLMECDPFACWDLEMEVTEQHEQNLRSTLSATLNDAPNLVFEYGTVELEPGRVGFFLYTRAFVQDGGSKVTTNRYQVFYHDNANHLTLSVGPDPSISPESEEHLLEMMSQEEGEAIAKKFFAAYSSEFGTRD